MVVPAVLRPAGLSLFTISTLSPVYLLISMVNSKHLRSQKLI